MSDDRSFWRNVTLIGVVHIVVLGGLARWSSEEKKATAPDVVWMDAGAASLMSSVAPPPEIRPDEAERPPAQLVEEDEPMLTAATSDLQIPTPTATPVPTPIPTPTPEIVTPTPTPTPRPRSSPSPTPKSSPRPTPKATPKPSASPKKTLLAKAELKKNVAPEERHQSPAPNATPTGADASSEAPDGARTSAAASGSRGTGGAPATASQISSYRRLLHDRFYKEWVQPTSVVPAGTKISALVKIRIEKDGRVTGFNIVQPSGNVLVDDSVAAVGKRVTQVDPLPVGMIDGAYEVKMNFELTLAQ